MTLIVGDPTLFGPPEVVGASSGEIVVRLDDKDRVDAIIRQGHYSGTTVWSSSLHFLVYADDRLIGAMQFGPGMNPASGPRVVAGSTPESWLELNRLWLEDDKPANTSSRAISCALRVIRHRRPKVEWVQSFADERCGKHGGVYQACSFLYVGEHTSCFYELDGEWFHKSMLSRPAVDNRGWRSGPKVAWFKQNQHRAVPHEFRQFRYLKFLNQRARARLLLEPLPYPKPLHPGGLPSGPQCAQRVEITGPSSPSGPSVSCQPSPSSSFHERVTRHHDPSSACAKNPANKSSSTSAAYASCGSPGDTQ